MQDAQNLARATMENVRRRKARDDELPKIGEYSVQKSGDSLTATISPTARDMLGISEDTEIIQYLDYETSAVISIPKSQIGDE